uniref:At2g35280-like TPR domain-containing protein n=1 Tax=Lactuca sativa TaxID=4236 RepID=A0A9R1VE84_LACSA|nr:hypothetical protein LSAT_V11C500242200 [Lactuca sativa]
MDIDQLRFHPFSIYQYEVLLKCKILENSNILFKDGMLCIFFLGEDEVGKQLLQDAADKGKLDAIFVLGVLLMAEGKERKQEALVTLNNVYISIRKSWNLKETCYRVRQHLDREGWLLKCDICLWDACLVEFSRMFHIRLD